MKRRYIIIVMAAILSQLSISAERQIPCEIDSFRVAFSDSIYSAARIWPNENLNNQENNEFESAGILYCLTYNDTILILSRKLLVSDNDYFKSYKTLKKKFKYYKTDYNDDIIPMGAQVVAGKDTLLFIKDPLCPSLSLVYANIYDNIINFPYKIGETMSQFYYNLGLKNCAEYLLSFKTNCIIIATPSIIEFNHYRNFRKKEKPKQEKGSYFLISIEIKNNIISSIHYMLGWSEGRKFKQSRVSINDYIIF